ncbi:MAG: hypothetical protein KF795_15105 [Labilithrix sp.]|nr:hypothetical protein [Labilithrix sp.]
MSVPAFTYSVAREAPEEVRDDLLRLWRANLTLATGADDKFRWLYRDAPDAAEVVFVLRARAANGAEQVVGTSGLGVRRFQLGRTGREGRAGVCGDLAVDHAHRGLLPALRLLRAVQELGAETFDVAYGFPNKKAEGVMMRAGFRLLGKARRRVRVLRFAPYAARLSERATLPASVARIAQRPLVARAAGVLVDGARLLAGAPGVVRAATRYRFAWAPRFDERFDALWASARSDYDIVGARTSKFLAWRYPDCEIATVSRRDDGRLGAYAIIERDRKTEMARIRDVFGHAEALEPLLDLLVPALWRRGAASASVSFLGAPRLARLLDARGFELRGDDRTIVVHVGKSAADDAGIVDAERWHLFDLDEDT